MLLHSSFWIRQIKSYISSFEEAQEAARPTIFSTFTNICWLGIFPLIRDVFRDTGGKTGRFGSLCCVQNRRSFTILTQLRWAGVSVNIRFMSELRCGLQPAVNQLWISCESAVCLGRLWPRWSTLSPPAARMTSALLAASPCEAVWCPRWRTTESPQVSHFLTCLTTPVQHRVNVTCSHLKEKRWNGSQGLC